MNKSTGLSPHENLESGDMLVLVMLVRILVVQNLLFQTIWTGVRCAGNG
jgi:hypothetical protein